MRIGELAKVTGVAASRIRFYEEHGVLPPALRRDNGYRDYSSATVSMVRLIDGAQALGFTLAELRAAFADAAEEQPSRHAMIAALEQKRGELARHIRTASARRRRIAHLIAALRGCDTPVGTEADESV